MMDLRNRPYLLVFAVCVAGVVVCALGLLGVGVVVYLPEQARLGAFLGFVGSFFKSTLTNKKE